jgi:hypothetical protein
MEDKTKLKEYITKRRKGIVETSKVEVSTTKPVAWYKRPLESSEFITKKGKDGNFYVKHNEWSKTIWIGPYSSTEETRSIIDSYVDTSLKLGIEHKVDSRVHSITIDNPDDFFYGC